MLPSRLSRGLLVSVAALVATSPNLHAAEWVAEPSVSLRTEYDDNPRLVSTNADSVTGLILDPQLRLSRRTQLWDMNARGRIRASKYDGQDGLDTTDDFLDLALKRRFERGSMNLSASQVNDTTFQNEEIDLDTGLTVRQTDRTRRDYELGGLYMLTEATWLQGSIGYGTVEYDENRLGSLTDYDSLSPSLTLVHQLDPKTQVYGVYSYSKTDYDRIDDLETTTDSLMLGAAYDISEIWTLDGSVGKQWTTNSFLGLVSLSPPTLGTFETDSSGLVYNLDLNRTHETGKLSLSASQSVRPSGDGANSETTTVRLRGDHSFSFKLSGALAVSYIQSERLGPRLTTSDNDRFQIQPSLAWRLDRDLLLSAGYNYRRINRSAGGEDVDSNLVYIGLGYTWPRMAVSR
jgi:hypothetical protein